MARWWRRRRKRREVEVDGRRGGAVEGDRRKESEGE